MNRTERMQAHAVGGSWMPNPEAHMGSPRDAKHFEWTVKQLSDLFDGSILDVGCYDGWLDFLLIRAGFRVEGVEVIRDLAASAHAYAMAHGLAYTVHQGFFDQINLEGRRYDAALCYEVLEHIPLEWVPVYVSKMEERATRRILISLPDQRHEDNPQHLWTPTMDIIENLWGNRKGLTVERVEYPGTGIPANFLIRWDL